MITLGQLKQQSCEISGEISEKNNTIGAEQRNIKLDFCYLKSFNR
jgi:hypothetical protein